MAVYVDASEVRALALDLSGATGRIGARGAAVVRKAAFSIEHDAKAFAPVDTGNLRGSISTDFSGDGRFGGMEAVIGPTADYGAMVEYGTQPHLITPNSSSVLAFPGLGGMVFTKVVHHPGTAPQPYMGPAFDRNVPAFEQAVAQAGEESVL